MTLAYGSLFSGIGGFDLGFDRAGMQCAWQVEYDAKARSVLARHWPDVQRFEDVRNVGRDNLRPVDVICGGFPCQDVSLAGKRAGLAGERSGLWSEFSRIIGELAPTWLVIENVPGLLSSNGGADMGTILWQLAHLGYGWAYRVLDAQYFGVAQRRRRVFIVGHRGTSGERAGAVLFEPESLPWHSAPRRETGQSVAAAVVSRIGKGGFTDPVNDNIIAPTLTAPNPSEGGRRDKIPMVVAKRLGNHHQRQDLDNETYVVEPQSFDWQTAGSERTSIVDQPGATRSLSASKTLAVAFEPLYARNGRGAPDVIAPPLKAQSGSTGKGDGAPVVYSIKTAQTGSNGWGVNEEVMNTLDGANGFAVAWYGAQITSPQNSGGVSSENAPTLNGDSRAMVGARRLMPVECERLQGFPDSWTAGQSDSARYKQLGNAVTVPVAEWIGRRIMEVAGS